MEGIQLFGAPSINLKPGSKRCCQNQATSGIDTRKPASAKMFAIQRMPSLFSLGTKRRRNAPTSGVKRMIERMWFCIYLKVAPPSRRLSGGRHACRCEDETPSPQPARGRRYDFSAMCNTQQILLTRRPLPARTTVRVPIATGESGKKAFAPESRDHSRRLRR